MLCWSSVVLCSAPLLLDTYMVNILIRAFFVAIAAVTVDIMWGYCGTLTFGQSAFFGIGVYALAIVFTEFGFGSWQVLFAVGAAIIISGAVAALTGWLSFYPGSTPLYASIVSLVVPIVLVQILYSGGTFTGSSSGLVGFETFDLSFESWFRLAGLSLAAVAVVALILMRSDTGRLLKALAGQRRALQPISASTRRAFASSSWCSPPSSRRLLASATPLSEEWPRRRMPVSRSEPG